MEKVKTRAMRRAAEALEYVEQETPVELDSRRVVPDFEVAQQEIALEKDVLGEFLKTEEDLDIGEVYVDAPDGRRRIHFDESEGDVEIEFSHPELAEDDAEFYKEDFLKRVAENKDDWSELFDLAEDGGIDSLREVLQLLAVSIGMNSLDGMGEDGRSDREQEPPLSDTTIDYLIDRIDSLEFYDPDREAELEDSVDRLLRIRELENCIDERQERLAELEDGTTVSELR